MLVSPHFVFLHMPKTGGGSVKRALRENLPREPWSAGGPSHPHAGWADIPPEADELPVLCFVRNPWDWYVSWYHFHRAREAEPAVQTAAGSPVPRWRGRRRVQLREDFATSVRAACEGEIEPVFGAAAPGLTDFYTRRFLAIAAEGLDDDRLTVGHFEHLFEDLEEFLRRAGRPLPEDFNGRVRSIPRVHASTRGSYRDYYDEELRNLVGTSCGLFVERFGYRF